MELQLPDANLVIPLREGYQARNRPTTGTISPLLAIAPRPARVGCGATGRPEVHVSALPHRILNRVRDKIEANLDTVLSLASLAEESGYSRAHFLRMFRAGTGSTPHQYVLGRRLSRAQDSLRKKDTRIIDVAVSCGFSSQSHMTSVFRQRLEMTPGEFRRKA
jgi:transcriptional regulator GlxA family with amidase domain